MTPNADVAVIGGGIAGCALAAFLAEAGASVRLYEREQLAAGASGRNSGIVQHPLDEVLAELFTETVALYRGLGHGFALPAAPSGVLVLGEEPAALEPARAEIARRFGELAPIPLECAELRAAEPALAGDLAAYRLETGYPVPPAGATHAFAERARAAGAQLLEGEEAAPLLRAGRVTGVRSGGRDHPAGAVAVCAGAWTPRLVDPSGRWRPIAASWGVNAELRLARPPRHALEQAGVEELTRPGGGPAGIFSLVTHDGVSALGSTFEPERPDPEAAAPALVERGARFVPALAETAIASVRACARPVSSDGRPLLGPVPWIAGLHVVAGHGPWGISLAPGSARLVAGALLEDGARIAPALAAGRSWR